MKNNSYVFLIVGGMLLSFLLQAQDMNELGNLACEDKGTDCRESILAEGELKNPADKGTMKLLSAGASLLYMGGVLNGVVKLPAFMGDVAKICVGSGLTVATNLLAFMNARGNGKKIQSELATIKEEAKQLQEKLESEDLRRSHEFQIEVFDFYMRAMERLQKITQLRLKQHGQNSSHYSIAMTTGTAEAVIYSLPWSSNPPMAKCGAKSAILAGIAIAMEKKAQGQAEKLLEEYSKRWSILAEIKSRLMMGTESLARADGDLESGVRAGIDGNELNSDTQTLGAGRDWDARTDGLSVTAQEYGCINSNQEVDQDCSCVATNTCYKTTISGWGQARYASAFTSAGLDGHISSMNNAFAGKNTDPSNLSMAMINQRNANAARLRDRLLQDYADKESKAKKKNRLGDKIGVATDRELTAFLDSNFKDKQRNDILANNSDIFAGTDQLALGIDNTDGLVDYKNFDQGISAISDGLDSVTPSSASKAYFDLNVGMAGSDSLATFNPKNIALPKDIDYDYIGKREDIVRNNGANLFEIISHRYQQIYRMKPAGL